MLFDIELKNKTVVELDTKKLREIKVEIGGMLRLTFFGGLEYKVPKKNCILFLEEWLK